MKTLMVILNLALTCLHTQRPPKRLLPAAWLKNLLDPEEKRQLRRGRV